MEDPLIDLMGKVYLLKGQLYAVEGAVQALSRGLPTHKPPGFHMRRNCHTSSDSSDTEEAYGGIKSSHHRGYREHSTIIKHSPRSTTHCWCCSTGPSEDPPSEKLKKYMLQKLKKYKEHGQRDIPSMHVQSSYDQVWQEFVRVRYLKDRIHADDWKTKSSSKRKSESLIDCESDSDSESLSDSESESEN